MSDFVLSQLDSENLKKIKAVCNSHIESVKQADELDRLTQTKLNAHDIIKGSSQWNSFIDTFIDFLFLVEKDIIKMKNFKDSETFNLGCNDITDIVEGFLQSLQVLEGNVGDIDDLQNDIKFNILSILVNDEESDLEQYLSNKGYSKDLENIVSVLGSLEESDDEYNLDVINDIKDNNIATIANQYSETFNKIMSILEAFYKNTFSLYPYPAVFAFKGVAKSGYGAKTKTVSLNTLVAPLNIDSTYKFRAADKTEMIYYDIISKALKSLGKVNNVSFAHGSEDDSLSHRCYNIEAILGLDVNDTIYYPMEAFAFATKAILIERNDDMLKSSGVNSYRDYKAIAETYIGDLLAKYIYKALEKYGKTTNENGNFIDISFQSDDFREAYNEIQTDDDKTQLYSNYTDGVMKNIQDELNKFIRCICSSYVVTRNDSNEYFKIKVTDFTGTFSEDDTSKIFNHEQFTQNAEGVSFDNAVVVNVCGCTIYEYSFCKNAELMDKKPLFGYTAARLFQKQGLAISSDNILLGEDKTGAPLFASKDSPVYLGTRLCHRFSAGSRSGKGVMTMNILASSLASENPVFYIDRKPDIGSCLAGISEGKMFVVNGGDTNGSTDTFNTFNPNSKNDHNMLNSWISANKKSFKRSYLTKIFGDDFGDSYAGAFGDFVYMKAMILALGIITARIHFTANKANITPDGLVDLAMDKKVTVVLDEITNWHHLFEHEYFCTDATASQLDKSAVKKYYKPGLGVESVDGSLDAIEETLSDDEQNLFNAKKTAYMEAKSAWEENKSDAKLLKAFETAKTSLEKTLKSISKKSSSNKSSNDLLCELYWSTFMDKYRAFISYLVKYTSAGYTDSMNTDNDVFYIGQFLNGYPNMGDPINFNKDGTVRQAGMPDASFKVAEGIGAEDRTRSYMLGFAEAFYGGCDWFIGRNIKDKADPKSERMNQFGGKALDPTMDSWLHTRGQWAFIPGGGQQQYRGGSAEFLPSSMIQLKPYLVLNTNDEMLGAEVLSEGDTKEVKGYSGTPYTKEMAKKHENDKYSYVYGAANRVGFSDWEKIRLSHIVPQINGSKPSESNRCYGKLEEGIGLKGLITEYKRTTPNNSGVEFSSDWLAASGMMADSIVQHVSRGQFTSYIDYLYDMSPSSIICVDDIVLAYSNDTANLDDAEFLKRRFPRYAHTNSIGLLSSKSDEDISNSNLSLDEDFFDEIEASSRTEEVTDINSTGVDEPIEAQTSNYTTQSPTSSLHDTNRDLMYGDTEPDTYEEDSYEEEQYGWSDEDRRKVATSMVSAYLLGIKTVDPVKANRLSAPQLRSQLVEMMYQLILNEGL